MRVVKLDVAILGGGMAGSATAMGSGLAAKTWLNSFSRDFQSSRKVDEVEGHLQFDLAHCRFLS